MIEDVVWFDDIVQLCGRTVQHAVGGDRVAQMRLYWLQLFQKLWRKTQHDIGLLYTQFNVSSSKKHKKNQSASAKDQQMQLTRPLSTKTPQPQSNPQSLLWYFPLAVLRVLIRVECELCAIVYASGLLPCVLESWNEAGALVRLHSRFMSKQQF